MAVCVTLALDYPKHNLGIWIFYMERLSIGIIGLMFGLHEFWGILSVSSQFYLDTEKEDLFGSVKIIYSLYIMQVHFLVLQKT